VSNIHIAGTGLVSLVDDEVAIVGVDARVNTCGVSAIVSTGYAHAHDSCGYQSSSRRP
jgi:hypothetical protein